MSKRLLTLSKGYGWPTSVHSSLGTQREVSLKIFQKFKYSFQQTTRMQLIEESALRKSLCMAMRNWIGIGVWLSFSFSYGQEIVSVYTGSELVLLRFHRDYLPPVVATGIMGGGAWEIVCSGLSHRMRAWADFHLTYPLGTGVPTFFPGASGGIAWQVGLRDPSRYYVQVGIGIDAYAFRTRDAGGVPIRDQQLRPIVLTEVGTSVFQEPLFIRYGFYPTPGKTSKYVIAMGTYF